ncbi:MAG: hypothetical protein ACPKPY_11675 [Nitrososphaeraceae archaeon]
MIGSLLDIIGMKNEFYFLKTLLAVLICLIFVLSINFTTIYSQESTINATTLKQIDKDLSNNNTQLITNKTEITLVESTISDVPVSECDNVYKVLSPSTPCMMILTDIHKNIQIDIDYELTENDNYINIIHNFNENTSPKMIDLKSGSVLSLTPIGDDSLLLRDISIFITSNNTSDGEIIGLDKMIREKLIFNKFNINDMNLFIVPQANDKDFLWNLVIKYNVANELVAYYIINNIMVTD